MKLRRKFTFKHRMKNYLPVLFIIFNGLICGMLHAQSTGAEDNVADVYPAIIKNNIWFYVDTSNSLDISDILQYDTLKKDIGFKKFSGNLYRKIYPVGYPIWIKIELNNLQPDQHTTYTIESGYPHLKKVEGYVSSKFKAKDVEELTFERRINWMTEYGAFF